MSPKVSFVGAGPGASDLITIRGARLLRYADVVIFAGSLVDRKLVQLYATNMVSPEFSAKTKFLSLN